MFLIETLIYNITILLKCRLLQLELAIY